MDKSRKTDIVHRRERDGEGGFDILMNTVWKLRNVASKYSEWTISLSELQP